MTRASNVVGDPSTNMPPVPRLFTGASVASLLLFVLALVGEIRGFVVQDVVWLRTSRLGSAVPVLPFDPSSITSANEVASVARYDPAFAHSRFDRYWSNTTYELHISRGRLQLQKVEDYLKPRTHWDRRPSQWDPATHSVGWRKLPAALLGIRTTHIHVLSLTDRMVEHTPLKGFSIWPILTLTAILPSTWIVKRFRGPKRGFCPECSYDLTGNTSGTCPECGGRISD